MALNPVNGSKVAPRPPAKSAMSGLASLQRMWDDIVAEEPHLASNSGSSSTQKTTSTQRVSSSLDETPFDGWHSSPERPQASNGKMSTTDFWSSMETMKRTLHTGTNNVIKAKAELNSKVSKPAPKRKLEVLAPSRPMKRKSEVIDLSDSEAEPVNKRRLPPTEPSKVLPWNQDHSKKKLAALPQASATTKPKPKPAEIVSLSPQQQSILDVVMQGKNVFFTGSAGTGKSVLLRSIIKSMRAKYVRDPDAIAVTASTGIAACNIGGVTLHSFGGIGLGIESPADLAKKIKRNQKATSRWKRVKVLVLDEISMLDGDLFDKLEKIARIIRGKEHLPFGGIQLVLTGDFFQLPPVAKGTVKFAFDANCWKTCMDKTFNLTRVFRQKDQGFVDMLNEMRFGRLSPKSIQAFSARGGPLPADDIEPTELFPRREDVDRANRERMERLTGLSYTYQAMDGGTAEERSRDNMLNNFMAPKTLVLKVNAQVMMIKNMDESLVNGTVGKIVDFMTEAEFQESLMGSMGRQGDEKPDEKDKARKVQGGTKLPVVEWKIVGSRNPRVDLVREESFKVEGPNGKIEASRTQLPLILAWAMSIHKSQGQTLERVKIDLSKVFEKGQAYVAISRATSLEGLQIIGFKASKVYAHPAVIEWSKTLST